MIINILIIVLCIAADQLTKICAAANLKDISTLPIIENIFHFTYVENRGAAFGMLADHRWVFMILSVVGIAAIFVYLTVTKPKSWWMRLALCFIVGGGVGNMIDRIARGYVIDFIDCRFINFYVFNVADSFVCVGCAMFIIAVIIDEVRERKLKKSAGEDKNV
ncbi:MAG: signal peptidase II [Clostridia bacterium]|nr:signal peptidase II [Clostridia bacterium]